MPRRKIDPLDDMLQYFTNEPLVVVLVVKRLLNKIADRRVEEAQPAAVVKVRRKRQAKPVVAEPAFSQAHGLPQGDPDPEYAVERLTAPKQTRKRKMRADSAPPANEAKPIRAAAGRGGWG